MRLFANSRFQFPVFAVLALSVSAISLVSATSAPAQSPVASPVRNVTTGAVCPQCGRIHASTQVVSAKPVVSSSTLAPQVSPPVATTGPSNIAQVSYQAATNTGTQNVLGLLNNQRSRQGLRSLRYDASLQAVAERRARKMASMGIKSHPPGSFAPGRYEGVGWSSSYSPRGVHACYTSNPNMSAAGAAMVRGRDGVYFAVVYR